MALSGSMNGMSSLRTSTDRNILIIILAMKHTVRNMMPICVQISASNIPIMIIII